MGSIRDRIAETEARRTQFMHHTDSLGIDPTMSQILFLVHIEMVEPGNFKQIIAAHNELSSVKDLDFPTQEANAAAEEMTLRAMDLYDLMVCGHV